MELVLDSRMLAKLTSLDGGLILSRGRSDWITVVDPDQRAAAESAA
jgi:hypothetical protein